MSVRTFKISYLANGKYVEYGEFMGKTPRCAAIEAYNELDDDSDIELDKDEIIMSVEPITDSIGISDRIKYICKKERLNEPINIDVIKNGKQETITYSYKSTIHVYK